MQVDEAAALLLDLLQTLAEKGIVTEGHLTIIRPNVPGLVKPVAYVQDEPVKTVRAVVEKVNGKKQPLPTLEPTEPLTESTAKEAGFTGDVCSKCGSPRVVRKGTCLFCLNCYESSGCS